MPYHFVPLCTSLAGQYGPGRRPPSIHHSTRPPPISHFTFTIPLRPRHRLIPGYQPRHHLHTAQTKLSPRALLVESYCDCHRDCARARHRHHDPIRHLHPHPVSSPTCGVAYPSTWHGSTQMSTRTCPVHTGTMTVSISVSFTCLFFSASSAPCDAGAARWFACLLLPIVRRGHIRETTD